MMKIKVAQASDRIVIQLKNGREITRYETKQTGKLEFWEITLPD